MNKQFSCTTDRVGVGEISCICEATTEVVVCAPSVMSETINAPAAPL